MLNVDPGTIVGVAKFLGEFVVEELGIDDAILALPPLEEFNVFLKLGQVIEINWIFLQLLVCQIIN